MPSFILESLADFREETASALSWGMSRYLWDWEGGKGDNNLSGERMPKARGTASNRMLFQAGGQRSGVARAQGVRTGLGWWGSRDGEET